MDLDKVNEEKDKIIEEIQNLKEKICKFEEKDIVLKSSIYNEFYPLVSVALRKLENEIRIKSKNKFKIKGTLEIFDNLGNFVFDASIN